MCQARCLLLLAPLAALAVTAGAPAQGPRFADLGRAAVPVGATCDVTLADFDRDGDLDVLLVNAPSPGPPSTLLFNDGHGVLQDVTATNMPAGPNHFLAVAAGDIDGDGAADLVLVVDWVAAAFLNDGQGVFTAASGNVPPPGGEARAVALGDVDGDGDLDLWIGSGHDHPGVQLFTNDGAGLFTNASGNLPATSQGITNYAIALGDVDGDQDLDALIQEEHYAPSVLLFVNDGNGVFTDRTASQMPALAISGSARDLQLCDVDGDDDLDLLVAASQVRLYRNDGNGTFLDDTASSVPAVLSIRSGIALGDFEADGDTDVWVAGVQDMLLANDGSGHFTDVTATALPQPLVYRSGVALGDLDGDGDPDAIGIGFVRPSVVCANLLRHLAWRSPPRVGQPLTMDVFGPTGGGYVLASSLRGAAIPLAPLGTLSLDPAWATIMGVAGLDAQGEASATFPVPADPAFVGLSIYWQALTVMPPRLGNLEVTTFAQ